MIKPKFFFWQGTVAVSNAKLVNTAASIAEAPITASGNFAYNRTHLPIPIAAHGQYKEKFVRPVLRAVGALPATFSLSRFDNQGMMQAIWDENMAEYPHTIEVREAVYSLVSQS